MECKSCHNNIANASAKFCVHCGSATAPRFIESKSKVPIVVTAGIVLLILGGVCTWILSNKQQPAEQIITANELIKKEVPVIPKSANCADISGCYKATLNAMSNNNIDEVRRIAEIIETFKKPGRGNYLLARKFNDEGLNAFREGDFSLASESFEKGFREDPSDVEIAANLGFARAKSGEFKGTSEVLLSALLLDPRRTSTWIPFAELNALSNQDKDNAVSALLIAYEWSTNREKAVGFYRTQANSDIQPQLRSAYEEALKKILNQSR